MCWDTRIRTWKNRTRICCVTITPYPNFPIKTPVLILTLQRYGFLFNPQIFEAFFSNQDTAFSFKKYCSSLVIVVKMLIFVHSDAEAPP